MDLDIRRRRIVLEPSGLFPLGLARLRDDELRELRRIATPLQVGRSYVYRPREHLLLPKLFVAAEAIFGRCPRLLGGEKTSFYVQLILSARRDDRQLHYLLGLGDLRGSANIDYYRLDPSKLDSPELMYYQPPLDREISRGEIAVLSEYFLGYLLGVADVVARSARPFFRSVPSEWIVYGKHHGDLFERTLKSNREYDSYLVAVRAELGEVDRQSELVYIADVIANIDGDAR